jgi:hypothetical protein
MRKLVMALVFAMTVIGMIPDMSGASVIPAGEIGGSVRADNMATIRAALEREEVAARLADYGLTPDEVSVRMESLTDQQVAEVAARVDKINAGGDLLELLLVILVVVLIVWLIMRITDADDVKLAKKSAL